MNKTVKYTSVSAKPGEPSILWIGASGRYYRTKMGAEKDRESEAYYYKPFPYRNVLMGALLLSIIVLGVWIYAKKLKIKVVAG